MKWLNKAVGLGVLLCFCALSWGAHAAESVDKPASAAGVKAAAPEGWQGVDDTVVNKFAEAAGRPPSDPWLNPQGDLLLFAFLVAGICGGFVCGYQFHKLFGNAPARTPVVSGATCPPTTSAADV